MRYLKAAGLVIAGYFGVLYICFGLTDLGWTIALPMMVIAGAILGALSEPI